MSEKTEFRAKFVNETEKARLLLSASGEEMWIPKSVFLYYSKDFHGDVKFSVEKWKEDDIENAGFKYF